MYFIFIYVYTCAHVCAGALVGLKRVLKSLESGEVVSCMMLVFGGNLTQGLLKSIDRVHSSQPPVPPAQVIVYQDFSKVNPLKEKY